MLIVIGNCCLEVSTRSFLIPVHNKRSSLSSVGLLWPRSRCSKHNAERDVVDVCTEVTQVEQGSREGLNIKLATKVQISVY